ncbi:MAG: type II toxin-antitoxin system RelE/ParE family toxin [Pseudomonadota bacterium]
MWKIKCYISSSGRNEIKEWYESLDDTIKGKVYDKIYHLYTNYNSISGLNHKRVHKIENSDGLYSVRLPCNKKEFRLVGFFREDQSRFISELIIVYHFTEKDTKKDYKKAIEVGNSRKREVLANDTRAIEYYFT